MKFPGIVSQLMQARLPSLAAWMAEPIGADSAARALPVVQQTLGVRPLGGEPAFAVRLAELILRYWSGGDIQGLYATLLAVLPEQRQRATLELAVGQLYIARKSANAWQHLEAGFMLAARLLEAEDYFTVLKRHETLRQLPLQPLLAEPASLQALLQEAQVIAQLKGRDQRPRPAGPEHGDTVD